MTQPEILDILGGIALLSYFIALALLMWFGR